MRGSSPGFRIAAVSIDEGSSRGCPEVRPGARPQLRPAAGPEHAHPADVPDHRRARELPARQERHHREAEIGAHDWNSPVNRALIERLLDEPALRRHRPNRSRPSPRTSDRAHPRHRDVLRRDLRRRAPHGDGAGGRARLARHPLPGRAPDLRRRGARAGQPRPRAGDRLGGGPGPGRRRDRARASSTASR